MDAQLNQWFTNQGVQAICWTLIHSVWIGLIASALAGLIIAGTRKSSPLLRYRLLCSVFLLFVLCSAYVLNNELGPEPAASSKLPVNTILPVTLQNNQIGANTTLVSDLVTFLNERSGWIFSIWLIFFIIKSIKLTAGMFYIRRVRNYKVHPIAEEWRNKVAAFSKSLGIRRSVTLLQSELVKVPVTVGLFKPVILLPVGMIFQLLPGQIDTILWHELAHIYRRDYLVNILQSIVEAVFFFNPAILWISALIREEREACCDDIVLENVSQKGNYLQALMAFQEHHSVPSGLAMALSLRKPQLMNRLRRMVNKENQRLSAFEMCVLLAGMMFLSAFTFIPEVKPGIKHGVAYIERAIIHTIAVSSNKKKPATRIMSQDLVAVKQDIVLPADTLPRFTSIKYRGSNADKANREMIASDDKGNAYAFTIVNNQLTLLEINGVKVSDDQLNKYSGLIRQLDLVIDQNRERKSQQITEQMRISAEKRKAEVEANEISYRNKLNNIKELNSSAIKGSSFQKNDINSKSKSQIITTKPMISSQKTDINPKNKVGIIDKPMVSPAGKKMPAAPDISADPERVRGVINVLIREKIVTNATDVESFGLSDTALTVNGKKQPQELQLRLKEAYGIKPGYGLSYGPATLSGGGIVIDKTDLK